MIRRTAPFLTCFALLSCVMPTPANAEDFPQALHAFLQHRVDVEKRDIGIVVGIVDQHGSTVIGYGKRANGTDQQVDGDTLFEIGSITKTFTGLLLADMVQRGQMNLDDPVARYLPASVQVPTYGGKPITLLQLATHNSGLPDDATNIDPQRAENPRADYSAEKLYAFLAGYKLAREPGTKFEYSTVGTALLGQAIALQAGTSYESLVVQRICRPLHMDSTRITLSPELQARFAAGHNFFGYAASPTDWGALAPGAALRSTANDLLKYLAANLGLTPSPLTSLMERTHAVYFHAHMDTDTGLDTDLGLAWMITHEPDRRTVIQHGGLTRGFMTFIAFEPAQRRAVVVLCNSQDFNVSGIGRLVLQSEWQSDRRPKETRLSPQVSDAYLGQYQRTPKPTPGAPPESALGIRREGDRLFAQPTGHRMPLVRELLPTSDNHFFERLSGLPLTFTRDAAGRVTGVTQYDGTSAVSYEKISDQPPPPPEPLQPGIAIKLDTKLLDACVGRYEFPPSAAYPRGMNLTIRRAQDQLVGQASGENALQGAFNIYPSSKTTFFIQVDGAQLILIRNAHDAVTGISHRYPGSPPSDGTKVN